MKTGRAQSASAKAAQAGSCGPQPSKPELKNKNIVIICGGPSHERGISLNSARSLFDNFDRGKYEISLLYVNPRLQFFPISELEIYSNTPLDFDYKLQHTRQPLTNRQLAAYFKKIDCVFPAIHGQFGEDGQLQKLLEKFKVPYVGSGPAACATTSDKAACQHVLKKNGFYAIPNWVVRKGRKIPHLPPGKYVAKPLHGGSSIGVQYIYNPARELKEKLAAVFEYESAAIIEPWVKGKEFTIIILQNSSGQPVPLLPTEIELYDAHAFFDYRKKYLATAETRYHTPARFSAIQMEQIQAQAAQIFTTLGMRDFARLDGWVLANGKIWFSDINAISGMEQNSFLFQQAGLLGLSHGQLLEYIVEKKLNNVMVSLSNHDKKEAIPVLFGGATAERQVSVMSGTNVWIKLKSSGKYRPVPHVLTRASDIYHIPHFFCLHHTAEEIEELIKRFSHRTFFKAILEYQKEKLHELGIDTDVIAEPLFVPKKTTPEKIAREYPFLFLGLHGGAGEDGTMQARLEKLRLPYNGSGSSVSRLAMDKFKTGRAVSAAAIPGITSCNKICVPLSLSAQKMWDRIRKAGITGPIIVKPRADGCSAGVVKITTQSQFARLLEFFNQGVPFLPPGTLYPTQGRIEMPAKKVDELLIEDFISTDRVSLKNLELRWKTVSNMIEVTVGLLGKGKSLVVMPPSQTIAQDETLSLEEKFMGGTGVNIVPPPPRFVSQEAINKAQNRLKKLATKLGIEGYARIDCFMHRKTGDLIIIEINTLPALTPSTTFFRQAAALPLPLSPRKLLEKIITLGSNRF